ncbi:hypothetical protein ACH5RR_018437 [Cinchona calisaya]|uniref:Reverse transcriptase RNase H-like domain-containing protein n=1 Tax=Cinchona calisaya TaxID=153742 RepID=A0ABD2ZLW7_9GENT
MTSTLVVALPYLTKPFIGETNASHKALGTVLMQAGRPIAFLSQTLGPRNQRLFIYEKELLSLIKAVTKWRHYLLGSHFIIKTDHQSLKFLLEQKIITPLQQKWLTKLLGLDYEIHYRKGKENMVADTFFGGDACNDERRVELSGISILKPASLTEVSSSYNGNERAMKLLVNLSLQLGT